MASIRIKAHLRRGKGGKTKKVKSYTRRIGKKGVRSPKRKKVEPLGEEFAKKLSEKKETPITTLTPEELAKRREVMRGFQRAEAERASLGMSREQYSWYIMKQQKEGAAKNIRVRSQKPSAPSRKVSQGILERIEDKVAKFVEKHSGKKYKRQIT